MSEIKRTILLSEEIDDKSIRNAILTITDANEYDDAEEKKIVDYKREPIKLIINTPGGDAYSTWGLVSVMKASKTPIHTYGYGSIMSGGLAIFSMGHKRFADTLSWFMYHGVNAGAWGSIPWIENKVDHWNLLQKQYDEILLGNTELDTVKMADAVNRSTYWFFGGEEALQMKLVDELITVGLERTTA